MSRRGNQLTALFKASAMAHSCPSGEEGPRGWLWKEGLQTLRLPPGGTVPHPSILARSQGAAGDRLGDVKSPRPEKQMRAGEGGL